MDVTEMPPPDPIDVGRADRRTRNHLDADAVAPTDMFPSREVAVSPHPNPTAHEGSLPWPALTSACLIAATNILVINGSRVPFLGPTLGFWFILIQPVYLLYTTSLWRARSAAERFGYSLATILLILMLAGLGINTLLPLVGVQRPLDPIPVVILGDTLNVSLYFLRKRRPAASYIAWPRLASVENKEGILLIAAAISVALSVFGANRLNNGAGDQLSLAALGVSTLTLLLLLYWRRQVHETIICIAIYLVSLSLLLMNSLRGWYVTGHDIQTEYQVFQLTAAHGRWMISAFRDAYNACLSITILPTELAQVVHVDDPYIYKVFFQLIFATCPVLVYTIARRYWPVATGILAATVFISFPTFITDMSFINRQEIAFVFVCVAVLSISNDSWTVRRRRVALAIICIGVELSHYSTMYVLVATLTTAWIVQLAIELYVGHRRRHGAHAAEPQWPTVTRTVSIGSIATAIAIIAGWGYFATQTAGAVVTDAGSVFSGVFGQSSGVRASSVNYNPVFGESPTSQEVLNNYSRAALQTVEKSPQSSYVASPNIISHYKLKAVSGPVLPLTASGRLLSDVGVPVASLNRLVRLAAADGEQLFIGIGMIAFIAFQRFRKRVNWEFYSLCVGSIVFLVAVTVLPDLSVDYGLLRAFQEALIFLAPVFVSGCVTAFGALGRSWGFRAAVVICFGIYVSTTGLLPQLLGGYPPQLTLNNSGQYYDSYYVHPQEATAVQWLSGQVGVFQAGVQATHSPNRFLFTAPSDVSGQESVGDAFPPLVRASTWLILDYSILHGGLAIASYDGDLIYYRYPVGILRMSKNLVYDNGGTQIYK